MQVIGLILIISGVSLLFFTDVVITSFALILFGIVAFKSQENDNKKSKRHSNSDIEFDSDYDDYDSGDSCDGGDGGGD